MDHPKVVLITGSSSGIGASAARLFARKGYKVAVTGSSRDRVETVAQECTELSPFDFKTLPIVADLNDYNNGELIVRETVKYFGKLDVLVNNAGIYHKTHSADKNSFELYKRTMTINVDSVVKTSMEAVPHLENTSGNIVFVSSVASIKPGANGYAYRMSKAAMSSYAKCLAVDVAPKIRVNIVSPGPVSTLLFGKAGISDEQLRSKMGPATLLGRVGESDEIANTIYYLASDEASFVNGAEIFVDGGYISSHQSSGSNVPSTTGTSHTTHNYITEMMEIFN